MTIQRIVVILSSLLVIMRCWGLFRQKGYRAFPFYFLGFSIGLILLSAEIFRYQKGDQTMEREQGIWTAAIIIIVTVLGSWTYSRTSRSKPTKEPLAPELQAQLDEILASVPPEPPPLQLQPHLGLASDDNGKCVLRSYDDGLIDRARTALIDLKLRFDLKPLEEPSGLTVWNIEVSTSDEPEVSRQIAELELAHRIENSTVRCPRCGEGMIQSIDDSEDAPDIIEHKCVKCGMIQQTNPD